MDQLYISNLNSGYGFYWFYWTEVYPLSAADH
jgi:hypothetical protein